MINKNGDTDYIVNQVRYELDRILENAAHGEITNEQAVDQSEDLVVSIILESLDDAIRVLYTNGNEDMLKHILLKMAHGMVHRSAHIERYYGNTDLEVK